MSVSNVVPTAPNSIIAVVQTLLHEFGRELIGEGGGGALWSDLETCSAQPSVPWPSAPRFLQLDQQQAHAEGFCEPGTARASIKGALACTTCFVFLILPDATNCDDLTEVKLYIHSAARLLSRRAMPDRRPTVAREVRRSVLALNIEEEKIFGPFFDVLRPNCRIFQC